MTAANIVSFFANEDNRRVIERLRAAGVHWPQAAPSGERPLAGRTVVLTGALASMTREQAGERLRALGAHVASSVSRRTDFVVVGDNPGAKARRAEELGVPMLDEAALLALLEDPSRLDALLARARR